MVNKKKKAKPKHEEKEKQEPEPELKILRVIEPELKEIKEEQAQEEQDENEIDENDNFQEEFFIQDSDSRAEAPILRKTDLEQTVEEIETPRDKKRKEKEEEIKDEGAMKYLSQDKKYFTDSWNDEDESEKTRGEQRVFKFERIPEQTSPFEKELRKKEKPIKFVEDWQRQGEPWRGEEILKYEQAEPEHGADLPFSPREVERRIKKYKKRL